MSKTAAKIGDLSMAPMPKKGKAKPQTEQQATAIAVEPTPVQRRTRRRRAVLTVQKNVKVKEAVSIRFDAIADEADKTFGDTLEMLLDGWDELQKLKR